MRQWSADGTPAAPARAIAARPAPAQAFSELEADFFAREAELHAAPRGDDADLYADDARAVERAARSWRRLKLLGAGVVVAAVGAFVTIRAGTSAPFVTASVAAPAAIAPPAPVALPAPLAPVAAPTPVAATAPVAAAPAPPVEVAAPAPVAAAPAPPVEVAPPRPAAPHNHHHHHHGSAHHARGARSIPKHH